MILFYGIGDTYKAVAYSTDASLDLSRSLIDVGGKTTGSWDEKKTRKAGWTMSSSHLLADTSNVDLVGLFTEGTILTIVLAQVSEHKDSIDVGNYTIDAEKYSYVGNAIITKLSLKATNGQTATFSVELTGTGNLQKKKYEDGLTVTGDVIQDVNSKTVKLGYYSGANYISRFTGQQLDTVIFKVLESGISYDEMVNMTQWMSLLKADDGTVIINSWDKLVRFLVGCTTEKTLMTLLDEITKSVSDGYLSKTKEDTAQELITFLKGTKFGTFVSGLTGTGGYIDGNGNAELQSLILRAFLEVPELRYNRVTVQAGNRWRAAGGGVVESVNKLTDTTGEVTLHLVDGDYGKIAVGDICMGVYHDGMTTANNFGEDYDDRQGNFKFKGFFTAYFTVTEITETGSNSKFKYSLRDTNGNWKFAFHPCEAMQFVCYGNFTNTSRQACVYETLTYSRLLRGVNTWEFSRANIGLQYGDLTGLTNNGNNLTGYGLYAKDNIYFEGAVIQLSPEQISEIASEAGGYSAHVSKNSDTIDVDDNGYPTTSLVTSDSGVSTYRLRSTMNVNRGSDILLYSSTAGVAGTYSAILQCKGCTADIANGTVRILTITGLNDGTSSYDSDVMKALTECSVDIQINCEGEVILQQTYTVTINHVASYYKLDLTNENSSVNCDKDGTVIGTFETSQAFIYKGASTDTGWTLAISDADGATASMADGLVTVSTITKDITSIKIAATKTGFATLYATYTITKVYAGKDGTAAVNYSLVPSVSVVKVDKLAAYSASAVSCGLARTTGANREVLSAVPGGYTFKYSINNGASFSSYTLGSSVDMTTVTTALVFELLDSNSKIIDLETIPLLKDGSDGKDYEYIYVRSTTETTPSTPATSQTDDYVPSGWTDDPSGVTATYKYEYISTRQKINGTWSAFSAPVIWARYAADGATGQTGATGRGIDNVVKRYLATSASSGVTSSSGSWSYSMVSPTSTNKYLWCWTNTYYTDGTYDIDYEIIAVCGQDGSSGSSGNNGCVIRTFENGFVSGQTYRNDTNYSTSGVRYLDFVLVENSSYASGYKVYQTVTTHSYSSGDESNSSYFTEVSTNAASAFFNYIVAKDASIKMLTGSFIGVKDSSGNIVAGLIGGDYPIFAGSSTPSSAPFRVGTDGSMYSTSGFIGGFNIGAKKLYNTDNSAQLEIGSDADGSSYFRAGGNDSYSASIRAKAGQTGLDIQSYGSGAKGLHITSNYYSTYAIESYGNVLLKARSGEKISINGISLGYSYISDSSYDVVSYDDLIFHSTQSYNSTINLPSPSSYVGKILFIINKYRKTITLSGTLWNNGSSKTTYSWGNGSACVLFSDGFFWHIAHCSYGA